MPATCTPVALRFRIDLRPGKLASSWPPRQKESSQRLLVWLMELEYRCRVVSAEISCTANTSCLSKPIQIIDRSRRNTNWIALQKCSHGAQNFDAALGSHRCSTSYSHRISQESHFDLLLHRCRSALSQEMCKPDPNRKGSLQPSSERLGKKRFRKILSSPLLVCASGMS